MSTADHQIPYWDSVANSKTFTHPLDWSLVETHFHTGCKILDYGCGYGRLTNELNAHGFTNITGIDTSRELIKRGKKLFPVLPLMHINHSQELTDFDIDYDAILLFAVLTCIPSNAEQKELVDMLSTRLKKGGLLYISDYYLQDSRLEVKEYTFFNHDINNYGVFSLPEGASFRHHTKEWIRELLQGLEMVSEKIIPVKTMNGHTAEAFQMLVRK